MHIIGSKTSSTESFIEYVKPKIALIGVGENNNFGHPNAEVLRRFATLNTKVYRTDINGEVSIKVDWKERMLISTVNSIF